MNTRPAAASIVAVASLAVAAVALIGWVLDALRVSPVVVAVAAGLVIVVLASALAIARRDARSARRLERDRIEQMLEDAGHGSWEWTAGVGTARSDVTWRGLGYNSHSGAAQRPEWESLVHPNDQQALRQAFDQLGVGDGESVELEYRVRAADSSWHCVVERGTVVERHPSGRPTRVLGMTTDVTDEKREQATARELQALTTMRLLAAHIAHEINNPLAGIKNSFLLVKDAIPTTHPFYRYVGAIEREIIRISTITRRLYETYRPASDEDPDTPASGVLGDTIAMLRQVNDPLDIQLDVAPAAETAFVMPNQLFRQLIHNLVQNAADASPPGGPVTVRAWMDNGRLWVSVRDRGAGLPAEVLEQLLDPDAHLDDGARRGGTGLGLSLARRCAEAMGAELHVAHADGGGTDFRVDIPATEEPVG